MSVDIPYLRIDVAHIEICSKWVSSVVGAFQEVFVLIHLRVSVHWANDEQL